MVSKCVFLRLWRLPDPLMASVYPDVVIVQSQRADEGSGVPVKAAVTTVTTDNDRYACARSAGPTNRPLEVRSAQSAGPTDRPWAALQIFGRRLGKSAERCHVSTRGFYLVADRRFAQCANYPTDQPTFSGPECAKCGTDRPTSPAGQGRSWVACTTLGRAQTKSVQF